MAEHRHLNRLSPAEEQVITLHLPDTPRLTAARQRIHTTEEQQRTG
jgi:hypothetical protein